MLKIECLFGYHTFPQKHCYNTAKKDYCKLEGKAVEVEQVDGHRHQQFFITRYQYIFRFM